MGQSRIIHDILVGVVRGRPMDPDQSRLAFRAPLPVWQRVLGFEGCGPQLDHRLRMSGLSRELPNALRRLLHDATVSALRLGMLAHQQLGEVAALATRSGVRVLALKGGAQLLGGHPAGARSISDIDLLVLPADGVSFHELLVKELGYSSTGPAYPHHLPVLERAGSLNIDLHVRLSNAEIPLDTAIWAGTRMAAVGGHAIELPSATSMVLHVLEHGVGLNWMGRYRLRDILDIATLYTAEVSDDQVRSYTAQSRGRGACETLLSAAHELEPRVPRFRADPWRTIHRVSRTRLAIAALPRDPRVAERFFRYAGVVAEGSPRTILRVGRVLARRLAATIAAAAMLLTPGCSDSAGPKDAAIPAFVFVSTANGVSGVYQLDGGVATRLSSMEHEDREPSSAAGRIVFSSRRDGNTEIYIADLAFGNQQRLTDDPSADGEPALNAAGTTIAFVSNRSGTPRIWLMDADGANPRAFATGSPVYIPERAPVWNPAGTTLAFTSTRTNTSQVFVAGMTGDAVQVTHESGGAFSPSWDRAGTKIIFTALTGGPLLKIVAATDGPATVYATDDRGLGEAACMAAVCLAVAGPVDGPGDIVAIRSAGGRPSTVVGAATDDRRPAFVGR